jgi:hypothetical protein
MSAASAKGGLRDEKEPVFKTISPQAGQSYIASAQRYCLRNLSEVVSVFCSGCMPIEMLEFPLSVHRETLLARRAGCYHNSSGKVAKEDQTAIEWRAQLIAETQEAYVDCREDEALELLFPHSSKKSREHKRSVFESQSLSLIQSLNMLWPSEALSLELSRDSDIKKATETVDLIAWINAFTAFCLNNSGNAELNAKAAEDTLEETRMKGGDLAGYIKAFKIAAANVKLCKSKLSEAEIVGTFLRNLNQSEDFFNRFATRHLDPADSLHSYVNKPLEEGITYAESYHKTVILTALGRKKSNSVNSVTDLKQLLESNNANKNSVNVPLPVLALYLKNNNNSCNNTNTNNSNNATKDANKKRKAQYDKEDTRKKQAVEKVKENQGTSGKTDKAVKVDTEKSVADAENGEAKKYIKRICYAFEKGEKCRYGTRCHFRHSA